MSVHRFVCYFLALSVCATIAFASSLLDTAAVHAAQGTEESGPTEMAASVLYTAVLAGKSHKAVRAHLQIAQAH